MPPRLMVVPDVVRHEDLPGQIFSVELDSAQIDALMSRGHGDRRETPLRRPPPTRTRDRGTPGDPRPRRRSRTRALLVAGLRRHDDGRHRPRGRRRPAIGVHGGAEQGRPAAPGHGSRGRRRRSRGDAGRPARVRRRRRRVRSGTTSANAREPDRRDDGTARTRSGSRTARPQPSTRKPQPISSRPIAAAAKPSRR